LEGQQLTERHILELLEVHHNPMLLEAHHTRKGQEELHNPMLEVEH
jgi:hypothetical protein